MRKINYKTFLLSICCFVSIAYAQNIKDSLYIESILTKSKTLDSGNLDSSRILNAEAFLLSKKYNYKRGICKSLSLSGNHLYLRGSYDSAKLSLFEAINLGTKINTPTIVAESYKYLGSVYESIGKKDSAFFLFYKALKLFEENRDSLGISEVFTVLAQSSFNYGETIQALNFLSKAEKIVSRNQDLSALSIIYRTYGMIYYQSDKYNKAIHYLLKSKAIDESLRNERAVAINLNILGACYEALDEDAEAMDCYKSALNYYNVHGLKNWAGEILFNIGVFFYNRDKEDSAVHYFEKALLALEVQESNAMVLKVLPLLSESHSILGNYRRAYETHVKYSKLNESLLNKEKIKQIAEVRTKYETEKKEQQITLLNEQNKSKAAQRNFFIAGSIILILILFGLSFYYRQRNKLARKNEQIAKEKISSLLKEQEIKSYDAMIEGQEEERKRIATDLHDRLGSMLSTVKILFGNLNEKIDIHQADNQKQYDKASSLLDEAVLEVRRIAQNLSTGMVITFGLIPALEELCESITESKILKCKFLCYGIEERMEQHIEIGVFRMMQEIVNNVLKHAKAKNLTIQLNRTEDSIAVTVEDNGVGFDLKEKSKGMGLKNLEGRAYKMGGTYNIDSKPGHGTISIIEIPLTHDTSTNS
ncbi:tetratricopeptide repeat-containing sensor histidine kinase [Aurantibacillus circumpalustris]|uniref:tetratricopeptide repeat-containing sensor histidine kinase n=1 Tax=Aurantibacillus circumpalustris TaxID=3036359 RepID=UPI00295BBE5E|nr:sensor histidine kinase [Aurantibacillus circumpalustris]